VKIRPYQPGDEDAVIELWQKCNLVRPQNNPEKDIERKMKVNPELFLVGVEGNKVIATAMGGYEGHRGWVNYLGIDPEFRRKGLGRKMMEAVEGKLLERGCPKLNLQVRNENTEAMKFYERIGYKRDEVISMGKRLILD
jgi:ribosomal protein S18 acetylase RimI-like enzyme